MIKAKMASMTITSIPCVKLHVIVLGSLSYTVLFIVFSPSKMFAQWGGTHMRQLQIELQLAQARWIGQAKQTL